MHEADEWYMCRHGFVETVRAVHLAAGGRAAKVATSEWPALGVIEVDQPLVEHASQLAIRRELGSLDSLHLAAALVLPAGDLVFATWDRRLHSAAGAEGLERLPRRLEGSDGEITEQ